MDAARARATVGEISDALEKVYSRHRAVTRSIAGVYGSAYEGDEGFARIKAEVDAFAEAEGAGPGCWCASWARTVMIVAPR